jgi:DNA-binding transcriptional ArsR family regulator
MAAKRKKQKKTRGPTPTTKLKQVIDPVLAKALAHPLRSHILATLGDRIASPNEMAKELGIDARDLNYHVRVLLEMEMIRLVRTEKRRGAKEHFYELSPPILYIDDRAWKRIPKHIRARMSASLFQVVLDEAVEALRAGTFPAQRSHQSLTPMILDENGLDSVAKLMDETLEKVLEIREKSAHELRRTGEEGIPIEVFMVGFETATRTRQEADREVAEQKALAA